MEPNVKKLIQLRAKISVLKEIQKAIGEINEGKIIWEDFDEYFYKESERVENELTDLKVEMEVLDEAWDEDETN